VRCVNRIVGSDKRAVEDLPNAVVLLSYNVGEITDTVIRKASVKMSKMFCISPNAGHESINVSILSYQTPVFEYNYQLVLTSPVV
jgi:hypothetical protein